MKAWVEYCIIVFLNTKWFKRSLLMDYVWGKWEIWATIVDQNVWRNRLGGKSLIHHDTIYMLIVCWILSIKPKVEIESTLEKIKFWMFASVLITFQLQVHKQEKRFELTSDSVLVFTCCSTTEKNDLWPLMLLAKFWHARYLANEILCNVEQK